MGWQGASHLVPQLLAHVQLVSSKILGTRRILAEGQSPLTSASDFFSPGDLMDTWCEFKMSAKQNTTKLRAGGGSGGKQKAEATGSGLWRQISSPTSLC